MNKTIIKIEGQDNNVAYVITAIENNASIFMGRSDRKLVSTDMYGLGDNPRWLGADLEVISEEPITQEGLDAFRREFPNVNAEVAG